MQFSPEQIQRVGSPPRELEQVDASPARRAARAAQWAFELEIQSDEVFVVACAPRLPETVPPVTVIDEEAPAMEWVTFGKDADPAQQVDECEEERFDVDFDAEGVDDVDDGDMEDFNLWIDGKVDIEELLKRRGERKRGDSPAGKRPA